MYLSSIFVILAIIIGIIYTIIKKRIENDYSPSAYLFKDFTFYEAKYVSPTRGVKIEKTRPFVEVDINGELYLVDILTKRIFKTSWFKENYDMEIIDSNSPSKFNRGQREHYKEQTEDSVEIATYLCFTEMLRSMIPKSQKDAEFDYELEQARKNYPEEWERYRLLEEEKILENTLSLKEKIQRKKWCIKEYN